jgi:peptide/nickel transport system ATP-binding protein
VRVTDAPLLEARDLTIQYDTANGPLTAVSNASFTIEEGEYFGLVGESGCGKSTIAKALVGGLDDNGRIASGTLSFRGEEVQDYSQADWNRELRWTNVSLIPQSSMNNLDPLRKISTQAIEIAQTHTDMTKREALDRFEELFEVVGLQADRVDEYPHQFSGGMQQRVIIALALFLDPDLIIADEPTTALERTCESTRASVSGMSRRLWPSRRGGRRGGSRRGSRCGGACRRR